jgi:hypothetical protein
LEACRFTNFTVRTVIGFTVFLLGEC